MQTDHNGNVTMYVSALWRSGVLGPHQSSGAGRQRLGPSLASSPSGLPEPGDARPLPGGLTSQIHLLADSGCRPPARGDQFRAARRLAGVRAADEQNAHHAPWPGPPADPARVGAGRQGFLQLGDPCSPAAAQDQRDRAPARRPGHQPRAARQRGQAPARA
jgi:hypothetical protein